MTLYDSECFNEGQKLRPCSKTEISSSRNTLLFKTDTSEEFSSLICLCGEVAL